MSGRVAYEGACEERCDPPRNHDTAQNPARLLESRHDVEDAVEQDKQRDFAKSESCSLYEGGDVEDFLKGDDVVRGEGSLVVTAFRKACCCCEHDAFG